MKYSLLTLACLAAAAAAAQASLDDRVAEQLLEAGHADVLVMFDGYPDLSAAAALPTKEAKAAYVYDRLRRFADRRLSGLDDDLNAAGRTHRAYLAAGAVYVPRATGAEVARLRQTAGAYRVAALTDWGLELPDSPIPAPETFTLEGRSSADTPEWGLRYVGAPEVWAGGVRGAGVVVGGQDTGYDWTHPALRDSYRGTIPGTDSAVHDYNWHDAVHAQTPNNVDSNAICGYDVRYPCDDNAHGTHTMGTMVGEADGAAIGLAPEAEWIACRNMDRGDGRPETYLECFEWFLAPTDLDGGNPRPDLAPHVIANSWGCPLSEGCDSTTYPAFAQVVGALRAAGVVVVVSAGNDGRRGCNTLGPVPALTDGVIAVAAHDSLGAIANFSSRGGTDLDDNPDIAAPGVAVRSSVRNGGYAAYSGTSMAGPHVAGVVALMISANPLLAGQVDSIEAILYRTADARRAPAGATCGLDSAAVPNAVFGYGTANALAAVEAARAFGQTTSAREVRVDALAVAPNPVRTGFTLAAPEDLTGTRLSVFDATGRTVEARTIRGARAEVSAVAWPVGVYTYRVESGGETYVGRIVRH